MKSNAENDGQKTPPSRETVMEVQENIGNQEEFSDVCDIEYVHLQELRLQENQWADIVDKIPTSPVLVGYRCAAHTIELAIKGVLVLNSATNSLNLARQMVKRLRNHAIMTVINELI